MNKQPPPTPGPVPVEVAGLCLVPQRSLAQACFLGGFSLVPALVEVAGLYLVSTTEVAAQACSGKGCWPGLPSCF